MLKHDVADHLERRWHGDILPVLADYVRIPNRSPVFDSQWRENGHMDRAVDLLVDWARSTPIAGLEVEVLRVAERTPVILCEVPPSGPSGHAGDDTVLLYGHLDKQPEFSGWRDGLGPWEPVLEDNRLYGRGTADDGYALFAALGAIEAAQRVGVSHRRCVALIEASEESGSPDLPAYIAELGSRLGNVSLVVALDSMAATWDRLWLTTSLRGLATVDLRVDMLEHGIHSGASGTVASTFRIVRQLLDRVEDAVTGRVLVEACHAEIPDDRRDEAETAAKASPRAHLPLVAGARAASEDPVEQLLAETWHPTISYVGVDGFPDLAGAGNVLRPFSTLRLSFRLPPTADSTAAVAAVEDKLLADPPYGAQVALTHTEAADGWAAPDFAPWLSEAADAASQSWFGAPAAARGIGGSIPFMAMLGESFPAAQFCITGVIGPGCTVHGPNEFLDLDQAARVTGCVADLLGAHADRNG